jgi:hypothetical protein
MNGTSIRTLTGKEEDEATAEDVGGGSAGTDATLEDDFSSGTGISDDDEESDRAWDKVTPEVADGGEKTTSGWPLQAVKIHTSPTPMMKRSCCTMRL